MNRDDIVKMARKADLWITSDERWAAVVRFARLVAAAERNKVELEWQTQKPVAWIYPEGLEAFEKGDPWVAYGSNGDQRIPLYPAPRQWQGLTDEEIDALEIDENGLPNSHLEFAWAIEAKLRDKNA